MGALIGDALGLGCHWYYDLDEMHRDYGAWIDNYTTPKSGRYHSGMKAGQLSQTGIIFVMLLRSVVENKEYQEKDFTQRLEHELFPKLNGTPAFGPGGYTNQSIREAYRRRVIEKKPWNLVGGHADTTEALERCIVLAAGYARNPKKMSEAVASNCRLTQSDEVVVAMSTAYNCILSQLIMGEEFTSALSEKLMKLVLNGELPFHTVVTEPNTIPQPGDPDPSSKGRFSSPDALLLPKFITRSVNDENIKIEPAWKVSEVYGMACAIYQQLPAAYYLAARFKDNFESAVLHALNGGGQNMSRAMLTGALSGAQAGLSNIPKRFIEGLENNQELVELSYKLAELAVKNG